MSEARTKDEWLREYEILRRVYNVEKAIWEIVQMAQQEYQESTESVCFHPHCMCTKLCSNYKTQNP